jgi:outer membrane protein OmpA-like peptidoglycan-associated protein
MVWSYKDGTTKLMLTRPGLSPIKDTRSADRSCARIAGLCLAIAVLAMNGSSAADEANPAADINSRLYQQLEGPEDSGKIETVSGQMYIPQENLDSGVINDALTRMLDSGQGSEATVSVQHRARLNIEIHFKKNSADLTDQSREGLDELGAVLESSHLETRFVLGGHTDLDGDESVNRPLSQARAEAARAYLVDEHKISPERLVAKGFGTSDPLRAVEETVEDKRYNRRVDLRPIREETSN